MVQLQRANAHLLVKFEGAGCADGEMLWPDLRLNAAEKSSEEGVLILIKRKRPDEGDRADMS